jgi:hypothetical protein
MFYSVSVYTSLQIVGADSVKQITRTPVTRYIMRTLNVISPPTDYSVYVCIFVCIFIRMIGFAVQI